MTLHGPVTLTGQVAKINRIGEFQSERCHRFLRNAICSRGDGGDGTGSIYIPFAFDDADYTFAPFCRHALETRRLSSISEARKVLYVHNTQDIDIPSPRKSVDSSDGNVPSTCIQKHIYINRASHPSRSEGMLIPQILRRIIHDSQLKKRHGWR